MTRIEIYGAAGSGKSTLAERLRTNGLTLRECDDCYDLDNRHAFKTAQPVKTVLATLAMLRHKPHASGAVVRVYLSEHAQVPA